MPRETQRPSNLQPLHKSPLQSSKVGHGSIREWVRSIALQGTWADVCAVLFLEWYPLWKQGPQAQELNWALFRRQVEEGARRFWSLDPMQLGRRGRPSVANQCFGAIENYIALQKVHIPRKFPPPTQGDYIRAIKKSFPKLKKETCRKHARLWQLLNEKKPSEFSSSDWKFLGQHRPDDTARINFALLSSEKRSKAMKEMAKAMAKMNKLPF
jgi:hypothetical protein